LIIPVSTRITTSKNRGLNAKYCKNKIKNIVRIIEIGPRITAKILKKF